MEKEELLKNQNYQGYGNYPPQGGNQGYPVAATASNPGYPPAAAGNVPATAPYGQAGVGYPPPQATAPYSQAASNTDGYQQQPHPGYPPVTNENYVGRSEGYPPATPQQQQQPPAPPAGKYAVPPAGSAGQDAATGGGDDSIATAPPIDDMDTIDGYAGNNFNIDAFAAPPSYEEAMRAPNDRPQTQNFRVPVINEDTARQALLEEVNTHCCWGKGPAEKLRFLDLQSSSAIHYTLETFTEGRSTKWVHEPYMGQPVDSPAYGPAPTPWNVQVQAATPFVNNVVKTEVPHTASIKPCHNCGGMGRRRCIHCHSTGWDKCHHCHNHGRRHHHHENRCHHCHGHGRRRCTFCHGNGTTQCNTCQGRAQLKCYIRLTVTWTNRFEDFVGDQTKLPLELLRRVNGEIAFQEEHPRVYPLNTFPDAKVNNASKQLVNKHSTAFPTERILMQRHKVRIIPITDVVYRYKDKDGSYVVYGYENRAYIKDYPSTCCGCCAIL